MKYALVGDFHSNDLMKLEMALDSIDPDVLVCLGDFDAVKTIKKFMELEERCIKAGKQVVKVIGNHDYSFLTGFEIESRTFIEKKYNQLREELLSSDAEKKYLEVMVRQETIFLDEKKFGKKYQTVIVHGAYDGDLSSYSSCPDDLKILWCRLLFHEDFRKNFEVMQKNKDVIMIRGHDHLPRYVYGVNGTSAPANAWKDGVEFEVEDGRMHLIEPGSIYGNWFAVIDTGNELPVLKFHTSK